MTRPFLNPDLEAFLFSPAEAEEDRRDELREHRKTRVQPSQRHRGHDAAAAAANGTTVSRSPAPYAAADVTCGK